MSNHEPAFHTELVSFQGPAYAGHASLMVTAKRYVPLDTTRTWGGENEFTLVLAHCIGSHKEQWEIVLSELLRLQSTQRSKWRIREAVSFDRQNHGDAGVLNERILKGRTDGVTSFEWGPAIAQYVSEHLHGHRVIGIGHSGGCSAMALAASLSPFHSLLLIEPTIISRALMTETWNDRESAVKLMMKFSRNRRQYWKNSDEAYEWLMKKLPWGMWDGRAVRLFADHGLLKVDADPDHSSMGGVRLKCAPEQEAATYPDFEAQIVAYETLVSFKGTKPIYLVYGDRHDVVPLYVFDAIRDGVGRDCTHAEVVEDAGHFLVQERPEATADALAKCLDALCMKGTSGNTGPAAKL